MTGPISPKIPAPFSRQVVGRICPSIPGRRAAWRALEGSLAQLQDGKQVKFLFLPEGEDPDSFVRKNGRPGLETLFERAAPLSRFLLDTLEKRVDLATAEGRAGLLHEAKPLIRQMQATLLRVQLLRELCRPLVHGHGETCSSHGQGGSQAANAAADDCDLHVYPSTLLRKEIPRFGSAAGSARMVESRMRRRYGQSVTMLLFPSAPGQSHGSLETFRNAGSRSMRGTRWCMGSIAMAARMAHAQLRARLDDRHLPGSETACSARNGSLHESESLLAYRRRDGGFTT